MAYRFQVFSGAPTQDPPTGLNRFPTSDPTADGEVDTVRGGQGWNIQHGKGLPVKVEAGTSITAGDDLETDSVGRAIPQSSGVTVARALEGASSGEEFWAVWQ